MKALGTGHSRGVLWKDIEVVRVGGPPQLRLHGGAARRADSHARRAQPRHHHAFRDARACAGDAARRLIPLRVPPRSTAVVASAPRRRAPSPGHILEAPRRTTLPLNGFRRHLRRRPASGTDCLRVGCSRASAAPAAFWLETHHDCQDPAERKGESAWKAGGRRAALRRRPARRAEADWVRRLGAQDRQRPERHVSGASVSVNGERRSFALLRPIVDTTAQERIRDMILQAYAEHERRGRGRS